MAKKNPEFFKIAHAATETARQIQREHRFDLLPNLTLQWDDMKAEALRIINARPSAQNGGPDCALCDDEEFWKDEFGDYWEAMRCATCSGWQCPNHHCPG